MSSIIISFVKKAMDKFFDIYACKLKREVVILKSLKPHLILDLTNIVMSYTDIYDGHMDYNRNQYKFMEYTEWKRPKRKRRKPRNETT